MSNSMQTFQDGIVIDLQTLKAMTYDVIKDEVTAGGGVLSSEFLAFVHSVQRETSAFFSLLHLISSLPIFSTSVLHLQV